MVRLKPLKPREAIGFFQQKGFKIGFDHRDVWQAEHQNAFTVAKVMKLDILKDIRESVDKALNDGKTFAQFSAELEPTLVRKGWWGRADLKDPVTGEIKNVQLGSPYRLKAIYDTNLRTAHSEGRWQRIQDRKQSMPFLQYDANNSEQPREVHSAWDGLVLPVDDPFWQLHYPVKEYGCKCRVIQRSLKQIERRGLKVGKPPKEKLVEYTNKRTGEITRVHKGVNPAFHYPAGQRRASLLQHTRDVLETEPRNVASKILREQLASPAFSEWTKQPAGEFMVGLLSDAQSKAIGAKRPGVLMSADTWSKQQKAHPEINVSEYGRIPDLIDKGEQLKDGSRALVFIEESESHVLVLKATGSGNAIFATSFRRLSTDQAKKDKELRRLRKKK